MLKPIVYLAVICFSLLNLSKAEVLKGVTVLHSPYIELNDGKLEGFANDMAKELADRVGFTYTLEVSPDGKYGVIVNNTINGMLGEVYNNRADFAIADITVTEERKQFVDFTEPFLESEIVILINKQYAHNITSFADLADQTLIQYGIMRNGYTHRRFAASNDSTIQKMFQHMEANPDNYFNAETKDRLMTTPYAMLVERPYAEQMVGKICELTIIVEPNTPYPSHFAIALPKGSAYLDKFNTAIRELKTSGRIDNMLQRYRKRCGVLKGVTIPTRPYSMITNGMMSGISVDLMNEISAINNYSYSLYQTYGEWYGGFYEQDVRGMIGDVYRKLADFAIADITVTDVRKNLVDFTEPLFDTGVVLVLNKNYANNISSFSDLAQQTDIKYGFLNESSTHNLFRESTDPTIAQLYRTMSESSDAFLPTLREGIRRAKETSTGFAFFTEGMVAEYIVGQNCELTIISDPSYPFPRQYAIALPKNSTYIQGFNSAINQLKTNGVIDTLKAKYWKKCA